MASNPVDTSYGVCGKVVIVQSYFIRNCRSLFREFSLLRQVIGYWFPITHKNTCATSFPPGHAANQSGTICEAHPAIGDVHKMGCLQKKKKRKTDISAVTSTLASTLLAKQCVSYR